MSKEWLSVHFPGTSLQDWHNWHWQMQNRVASVKRLCAILGRPAAQLNEMRRVVSRYPASVTPYYLSLIPSADKNDPLALQCIPDVREISVMTGLPEDPLNEDGQMPAPKLIHRYPDRALAMVTQTCATHCRHCNRKRFWKAPQHPLKSRLSRMIRYIEKSPQIREIIISGGDPLTYDDHQLEWILSSLTAIPHVDIVRIGSRMPAVLPMRITKDLCRILKRHRPLWFNTQFNHPDEITPEAKRACERLQETGIPVSNQSVLLKGVNDNLEVMRRLLNGLQKISVRPYYLFHCEPVRGCGHFRTELSFGLSMMEDLRRKCSGLSLPQYVADLPGNAGKAPLCALSGPIKTIFKKHQDFFDNFS